VYRSIQGKLVLVYLLLILAAMELTGLYLLRRLEAEYINQVHENLDNQSQLLVGLLSRFLQANPPDRSSIQQAVEGWRRGAQVVVLDGNGIVLAASHQAEILIGKKFTADDTTPALTGGIPTRRIGEEEGERLAYRAQPITVREQVVGVVYLKASLAEAYAALKKIRDTLVGATLFALALTAALGVLLARTITGPVRVVTRKAAEMAGGNFDQVIEVRSNDEIGQLGQMFNLMSGRLKQTLGEIQEEKRKAEAILSYMADGILALNAEGRIIKMNPAAERLLQTPESEALGRLPLAVWPQMTLAEAVVQARGENRVIAQEIDLGDLVLLAHVTPLKGERGAHAGTVVVFHDITELQKLEGLRREFVANVSHELKTPLTTVKSYVETLLDGAADDPELRARFLGVVESETDRMARLVRDLLQLSQLDKGTADWDIQPYDLVVLAEEALSKLAVTAERKSLRIERSFGRDLPPALVDRDKFQQVILNVLANAIEFTPAGGRIDVDVRSQGSLLRVRVRDSGIGIPKEDLPRIFERFYRVDKARSRMLGGTGLGLAIARQIIEGLGGTIRIESQYGKGTEVIFTVPAAVGVVGAGAPRSQRWMS
jgi:two-component system, OmpR family, sensor histidine kinase VicK